MRRFLLIVAALAALALSLPLLAGAAKPPKPGSPDLTIGAKPDTITFGRSTTISGQLRTQDKAGKKIDLQEKPHGENAFKTIQTATTETSGAYSFTAKPGKNTRYRVIARVMPPLTSGEVDVAVRFKVSLRLSDYTPRAGQLVRFSGSVLPEHDGRIVYIQRRTSSGSFTGVARTTLRDAGTSRSVYSRRIRIGRDSVFRARVVRDADHATGTSAAKRADVH
jgi:hypothetical protein